jgi:hypothetical protein
MSDRLPWVAQPEITNDKSKKRFFILHLAD